MAANRFDRILTAGWLKAAVPAEERTDGQLIPTDQPDQHLGGSPAQRSPTGLQPPVHVGSLRFAAAGRVRRPRPRRRTAEADSVRSIPPSVATSGGVRPRTTTT